MRGKLTVQARFSLANVFLRPMTFFRKNFQPGALLVLALLGGTSVATSGCKKTDTTASDQAAADDAVLQTYAKAHNITNAQRQASGLYFVPDSVNASATPAVAGKTISVLYTGQLTTGNVFDATSLRGNQPFSFVLGQGQVIAGWDEGIALMHKGDKARLLIPSALGYGTKGTTGIPVNSVLVFNIQVLDVR